MEPRTRVSVLPYETKKTVFTKAKQTIGNRLAGRAAKGAIPVDRTKNSGIPRGVPLFFCVVYSLQPKYLYAGSREKYGIRKHGFFLRLFPYLDALPNGQIPVDRYKHKPFCCAVKGTFLSIEPNKQHSLWGLFIFLRQFFCFLLHFL